MPSTPLPASGTLAPIRSPALTVLAAWLVPGSGHFLLGHKGRAAVIFATVVLTFTLGVLMHGALFSPSTPAFEVNGRGALTTTAQIASQGDVLSKLIQYGGFLGNVASGVLYWGASLFGYNPPDMAGHSEDYGSKFLVAAGLLNVLAMVDAFEITTRQKD